MDNMDINATRNDEVRRKLISFFDEYGVSKKFFSKEAELDYGLFTKFVRGQKNYVNRNLDKIERVLEDKYNLFSGE